MNLDLPIYDSNVLYVLRAVFLPGAGVLGAVMAKAAIDHLVERDDVHVGGRAKLKFILVKCTLAFESRP